MTSNPFLAEASSDEADAVLATSAAAGNKEALEELIRRHQGWIYNIAIRMVVSPDDASDITQEALLRIVTRIAQFEGRSSFRTWAYRIVTNCFLDMKRRPMEKLVQGFEAFGQELDRLGLDELNLSKELEPERAYIIEEAKVGCMLGMLLCLSREQRIVYILGEVLEAPSELGAEILDVTPVNFRQRLTRARAELHNFMNEKCGLVNKANPCRCPKKTRAFIREGYVDPKNLKFAGSHLTYLKSQAEDKSERLEQLVDRAYGELFRSHPFQQGPDMTETLHAILDNPEIREVFNLSEQ